MGSIKIWQKIKGIGPEFIMTTIAQSLYLLQSVVQNKIFTSFFSTSVFGMWSLIVSAYTLVSMIPFSALDQGIYRTAFNSKKEGKDNQLYSMIAIFYFTGFLLYTFIFVWMNIIQGEKFFAYGYTVPFLLYSFSEILKNTYVILDNAYRNRKRVLIIRVFGFASRTILFLVFHHLGIFTLESVLWILFGTNLIILAYQNRFIRNITLKIDSKYCKQLGITIIKFSGPLLTWAVFGWMQNMISRWYLDALLDLESVAMYSVLTTLSFFVPNAVYTIINSYVMPIVFQDNRPFTRKSSLKYIGLVASPMMIYWLGVCFLGKYLILILTDTKYLDICKYLPLTTFTAVLYAIAMLSTVEIYRRGDTKRLIISTILPGLFMATVGYVLINKLGFTGAVVNYMSGHIIYVTLTFLVIFNKRNLSY